MIKTDINWAEGIRNIFNIWHEFCDPFWEWFFDGEGWMVLVIVTGVVGLAIGISSCCVESDRQKTYAAKFGITETEGAVMAVKTALLRERRENESRVTKAMLAKKEQALKKAEHADDAEFVPVESDILVADISPANITIYMTAVNKGYGEWVIIDNQGHTAFRWKNIAPIESAEGAENADGWKWFGWFRK